jgi:hypothetical protein
MTKEHPNGSDGPVTFSYQRGTKLRAARLFLLAATRQFEVAPAATGTCFAMGRGVPFLNPYIFKSITHE